jgi:hypothetical protein
MRLRSLLLACIASATAFGVAGCIADGGYGGGGYGYDYEYYGGPDADFYSGWGPGYYVVPGHFHGRYGPRGGHPYRAAPGGHLPPSLPRGAPHGAPRGGAIPHGGAPRGGVPRGGGGRGGGPRGH